MPGASLRILSTRRVIRRPLSVSTRRFTRRSAVPASRRNRPPATRDYASRPPDATIDAVAARLRERNFEVVVVEDGAEAKRVVLEGIPKGAEVHSAKSKTLDDAAISSELKDSGRYDFLRTRL